MKPFKFAYSIKSLAPVCGVVRLDIQKVFEGDDLPDGFTYDIDYTAPKKEDELKVGDVIEAPEVDGEMEVTEISEDEITLAPKEKPKKIDKRTKAYKNRG